MIARRGWEKEEEGGEVRSSYTYPRMVRRMFMQRSPPQPETVKTPNGGTVMMKQIEGSLLAVFFQARCDAMNVENTML